MGLIGIVRYVLVWGGCVCWLLVQLCCWLLQRGMYEMRPIWQCDSDQQFVDSDILHAIQLLGSALLTHSIVMLRSIHSPRLCSTNVLSLHARTASILLLIHRLLLLLLRTPPRCRLLLRIRRRRGC